MSNDILLVEGSAFLIKMMERQISGANYHVKSFVKPHLALEILGNWTPSVALVDLDLELEEGFELIKALLTKLPNLKIICYSSADKDSIWSRAQSLGALYFFPKPIPKESLIETLSQIFHSSNGISARSKTILESPSTQPFEIHIKGCYICGHEKVKLFVPKPDSYDEDWTQGVYPLYHPKNHFDPWDFFKTTVTVCPKCLFASSDIRDFGEPDEIDAFPYKPDAKKLIAIGMGTRRKMVGVNPESGESNMFDSPYRSLDTVQKSFMLASKCGNGLIMGDKIGAHADIGINYLFWACLEDRLDVEKVRYAQQMFYDQLKIRRTPREILVKCFYFIIAIHFGLGESIKANEAKDKLEKFYLDVPPEDASEQERLWNSRLLYIWQEGVDQKFRRPF